MSAASSAWKKPSAIRQHCGSQPDSSAASPLEGTITRPSGSAATKLTWSLFPMPLSRISPLARKIASGRGPSRPALRGPPSLPLRARGSPQTRRPSNRTVSIRLDCARWHRPPPQRRRGLTKGFSAERALDEAAVYLGICKVAIPKSHKFGSVGSAWWKRFLTLTDDRLELKNISPLASDAFWASARQAIAQADPGERMALVFIHGFNVTFEEAAIRAAQIGFDLKVPGITAFFSWPSKGRLSLLDYAADEATIDASADKMTDFLVKFAQQTDAERVHVIAHSMGNRGLLGAMQRIVVAAARAAKKPFHHVVFAAPDVDAAVFRDLAKAYRDVADHATLYVSSHDRAVKSSGLLHAAPRAGFVPPVTLVDGIDTVEVSNADLTLLGHGYYGAAAGVLYDMRELLIYDTPPKSRTRLSDTNGGYWQIGE